MILLYTSLLVLLGTASFLIGRRARGLEGKYIRAAQAVDHLLHRDAIRPGNGNKPDVCLTAKRQYQLGQLVEQRDRIEHKYVAWQQAADKIGRAVARVREWKGRKLPYTMGVVDVSGALWLVDYLGVGNLVSARRVLELVTTWYSG
jgi:hypothetical protein